MDRLWHVSKLSKHGKIKLVCESLDEHLSFVRFWEHSTFSSFVSRCGPWALLEAVIEAVVRAWSSVSNTWSAASQRLGPKCEVSQKCKPEIFPNSKKHYVFFFGSIFFWTYFSWHQTSDINIRCTVDIAPFMRRAARWGLARLRFVGSGLGSLVPTPGLGDRPTTGALNLCSQKSSDDQFKFDFLLYFKSK